MSAEVIASHGNVKIAVAIPDSKPHTLKTFDEGAPSVCGSRSQQPNLQFGQVNLLVSSSNMCFGMLWLLEKNTKCRKRWSGS